MRYEIREFGIAPEYLDAYAIADKTDDYEYARSIVDELVIKYGGIYALYDYDINEYLYIMYGFLFTSDDYRISDDRKRVVCMHDRPSKPIDLLREIVARFDNNPSSLMTIADIIGRARHVI